jgi:hypothetical protein
MKYLLLVPAGLLLANVVNAFDFGGLSDPFDWYGGKRYTYPDSDYSGYGYPGSGGYGYSGLGGYGSGYPGSGGYGYSGLGDYGSGYPGSGGYGYSGLGGYGSGYPGSGGYGYSGLGGYGSGYPGFGGYDGYAPENSAYGPPSGAQAAEIERLKERIKKLEQAEQRAPSTFSNTTPGFQGQPEHQWPASPAGAWTGYPGVAQPPAGQSGAPVYQPSYGIPPRYRFQ